MQPSAQDLISHSTSSRPPLLPSWLAPTVASKQATNNAVFKAPDRVIMSKMGNATLKYLNPHLEQRSAARLGICCM